MLIKKMLVPANDNGHVVRSMFVRIHNWKEVIRIIIVSVHLHQGG